MAEQVNALVVCLGGKNISVSLSQVPVEICPHPQNTTHVWQEWQIMPKWGSDLE